MCIQSQAYLTPWPGHVKFAIDFQWKSRKQDKKGLQRIPKTQ